MAVLAGNTTASFAGTPLGEAYAVSIDLGGGMPSGRSTAGFLPSGGTVTVELYGSVTSSMWGSRGQLVIGGKGVSLTETAVCTSVGLAAQVNDAVRATVTFQIIK